MRLLLPQLDIERGGYGVKEKKMAELYIKAIPLHPTSADAKKLKNFKKPRFAGPDAGDFTKCLFAVLRRRCTQQSTKTIGDANSDLTVLQTQCGTLPLKIRWFQSLITNYTAKENKWLMRIILKNLACGVKHESTFKRFHERALETYNMSNSLEKGMDSVIFCVFLR